MNKKLSPTERETLALLARGTPSSVILASLIMRPETFHVVCYNIRKKTGIVNTKDPVECRTWERNNRRPNAINNAPLGPSGTQLTVMRLLADGQPYKAICATMEIGIGTAMNAASQGCKRAGITAQGAHRIAEIRAYLQKISPSQVIAPEDDPAFR